MGSKKGLVVKIAKAYDAVMCVIAAAVAYLGIVAMLIGVWIVFRPVTKKPKHLSKDRRSGLSKAGSFTGSEDYPLADCEGSPAPERVCIVCGKGPADFEGYCQNCHDREAEKNVLEGSKDRGLYD